MDERTKYELCWKDPRYRSGNGGLPYIDEFKRVAGIKEGQTIVDFGCGEGRTLAPLETVGAKVILIDLADNCLAENVPRNGFLRHDLSEPLHLQADAGFCVDMMEHIPTHQVNDVLTNIFNVVNRCYFNVDSRPDSFGKTIGETLHLTVQPWEWWADKFAKFGEVKLLKKNGNFFRVFVNDNS